MAKTKAADAPKKKKKSAAAKGASLKAATKGGKNKGKSKSDGKGFETLMKLADHPLVADLLAVGAMAAVAAIAEQGFVQELSHRRCAWEAVRHVLRPSDQHRHHPRRADHAALSLLGRLPGEETGRRRPDGSGNRRDGPCRRARSRPPPTRSRASRGPWP